MYIDTHTHLYSEEFEKDYREVVNKALENKVNQIILPDIDNSSRERMIALSLEYPTVLFPTIGLHPTSVNSDYKNELKAIEKYLGNNFRFYAIGECGIDLYWDKTYFKEQVKAFEYQLGLAKDMDLPVIIHSRESLAEILNILKKHSYIRGVLHCFAGEEKEALLAKELNFMLGIGGVITFKNSNLSELISKIGVDNIVLETDSPYLAPVPYRGKRNESSYIPLIAHKIAEILELDIKKVAQKTTENAMNLFNLHTGK